MKPLLIAHRGDTINFPENSIDAFQSAFDKGTDGIELDAQFFDGNLIVVHDYLFDRNQSYPFLSQILDLFSNRGRIEIEIKSMEVDFLSSLKKLLIQYNNSDIEITTSVYPLVNYLKEEFSAKSLGIIFHEKEFEEWMTNEFIRYKIIRFMQLFRANVAHIPWKFVDQNIVDDCHQNEIKVHSHIFKQNLNIQANIYKEMEMLGLDQCTFDDISFLTTLKK